MTDHGVAPLLARDEIAHALCRRSRLDRHTEKQTMDTKTDPRGQDVSDELRTLRDELHHMARRAAADDVEDLKDQLESRYDAPSPSPLVVPNRPSLVLSGGDNSFIRSVIGAVALLGLALGGNWTVQTIADDKAPSTVGENTRTFKPATITLQKPVYDIVMQDEKYTVQVPVIEKVTKDETYTVSEPITKIVMVEKPYTVRRPIRDIVYRDKVVSVRRPKTETVMVREQVLVPRWETVPVFNGFYWVDTQRYVEAYETRLVPRTRRRMVAVEEVRKVPVESIRYVKQRRYRKVPVKETSYVDVEKTRQVSVDVTRYVTEERTRKVPTNVLRYETEQQLRMTPATDQVAGMPAPAL